MANIFLMNGFLLFTLLLSAAVQAAGFDYRHYASILNKFTEPNVSIDGVQVTAFQYQALAAEAQKPGSDYPVLLSKLAAFNPETLDTREDKLAFWINVYNIAAIKTILDHYPVDSIRSRKIHWLGLPWDRKVIRVGGRDYSLGQIENDILLDTFKELKIHLAINCASVSCVDLAPEPYLGATLAQQLDEQGKRFLGDRQKGLTLDRGNKKLYLSQVFKFDKKRFDGWAGGAIPFVLPYLRAEDREWIEKEKVGLEYLPYNWKLNEPTRCIKNRAEN